MPNRFTSLSQVISNQIASQVPNFKMPDGSSLNSYVGNIPLTTEYNIKSESGVFRWGTSVWGIDNITSEYAPKTN